MTARNRLVGLLSGILVLATLPVLQAQAAAPATAPARPGTGWSGSIAGVMTPSRASSSTVNVSRLPSVASTKTGQTAAVRSALRLKNPSAYAAAKSTSASMAGTQIPQLAANNVDASFTGIDSFTEASIQAGSVEPPDTQMAVGNTQIVEMVNQTGQVYDKTSHATIGANFSLKSLFNMASNYLASDPRILYDRSVERWYATMLGFDLSTNRSTVFLAVSSSSDATGVWHLYTPYDGLGKNTVDGSNLLCDQPKLGYSADKITIACTDFDNASNFYGAIVIVASKSQAVAGATLSTGTAGPLTAFGVVPAQDLSVAAQAFMVENLSNGPAPTAASRLWGFNGDPALGSVTFGTANVSMIPTTVPFNAVQKGSATLIDTGDDRFMSAVIRSGQLWTSAAENCTPATDTAVRTCMRVLHFDLAAPTLVDSTTSGVPGKYIYYPTLSLADTGNVAIVYSRSSSADYPGVYATQQLSGSPGVYFGGGALIAGTQPYAGGRWGDYSAAAIDFYNTNNIWVAGEWSTATGSPSASWSTQIGRLANWSAATVPDPPTAVNATAGDSFAALNWTEPNDGGKPITSYTIHPFDGATPLTPITTGSPITSATVSALTDGHTYTFTVAATNSVGTGNQSLASNAVTPSANAPGQTTGVVAAAGIGSAILSWTAPATGAAPTSYTIQASPGPAMTVTGTPPLTQAVMPGLTSAAVTFTVTATNGSGTGPVSSPSNSVTPLPGGTYNPLVPARLLDTRFGTGVPVRPAGPLGAGQSLDLQVTGQGGVPMLGVSGAVLNVTITAPTNASFLSVWPQGSPRPLVSNLNWIPGKTVANLVEVAVNPITGRVSFFNPVGNVDVIVDVQGYVGDNSDSYTRGGLFNPLPPKRDLDTRFAIGAPKAKMGPGATLNLVVTNVNGVPVGGVSAVVLNVTAVVPSQAGFLTVWPTGATRPTASNVNFVANQVVPNRVVVKVGTAGQVSIYNPVGTVDVVADVNGWFSDATSTVGGSAFIGVLPTRIFDTRTSGVPIPPGGKLRLGPSTPYTTPHSALVLNVTAVTPTSDGFLTLYPDNPADTNHTPPNASDLNFISGDVVPNLVVVGLGPTPGSQFDTYNPTGSTHVVYDLDGYYGAIVAAPPP
jgi:Fibronectin type III domain